MRLDSTREAQDAVRQAVTGIADRGDVEVEVWWSGQAGPGYHIRLHKGRACVPVCPLPPSPYADCDCSSTPQLSDSLEDWPEERALELMVKRALARLDAACRDGGG